MSRSRSSGARASGSTPPRSSRFGTRSDRPSGKSTKTTSAPIHTCSHPRRLTWRLDDDGKTREIIVDGFPAVKVPPLDELLQTLLRLRHRDEGPVSTRWTWTTDGDQHTRDFDGEPAENAKLAAALDLVMPAPGDASAGTGDDGHDGAPLLEIQWLAGDSPGDLLTVYPDGARVLKESGSVTRLGALPDGSVTELKTQLELLAPD